MTLVVSQVTRKGCEESLFSFKQPPTFHRYQDMPPSVNGTVNTTRRIQTTKCCVTLQFCKHKMDTVVRSGSRMTSVALMVESEEG